MTPENFCYWLQGYFELNAVNGSNTLTDTQTKVIQEHLQKVFTTPKPITIDWSGTRPLPQYDLGTGIVTC